jgi:ABC-type branched-subunit amino acid transport system substrate-binding protein
MFLSVAGVPVDELTGDGKTFIDAFSKELGGEAVDPYAAYGAQAAVVLLDAIERAGGTERGKIAEELFNTKIENGILGSFEINDNGDPELASGGVVGFTIYKAADALEAETTISPKQDVVDAARGS